MGLQADRVVHRVNEGSRKKARDDPARPGREIYKGVHQDGQRRRHENQPVAEGIAEPEGSCGMLHLIRTIGFDL